MRLNVLECILHNTMLSNQILQFPTIGVLLNALCDDAEAIQVYLLVLCVLKVIPDKPTHK